MQHSVTVRADGDEVYFRIYNLQPVIFGKPFLVVNVYKAFSDFAISVNEAQFAYSTRIAMNANAFLARGLTPTSPINNVVNNFTL